MKNIFFFFLGSKSNGSAVPITLRNRPRIPTPDVTKEVMDRENRIAMGMQNMGVIMAHQGYQNEVPVLGALVLSPIQELDSGSVNNTLHAGQPGTTALAQAVLSPALGGGGMPPMIAAAPVTLGVSQLTSLVSSAPSTPRAERGAADGSGSSPHTPHSPRATVTELPASDRDSEHSNASTGTPPEFARKRSSSKRGEVYV